MSIFKKMEAYGHEQLIFCYHKETGLRSIIAIHNTEMGPALGGCRMKLYQTEEEAVEDALRLSRGMTYKSAIADVDFGGGKAVILADPKAASPAMFRAFGRFVGGLGGRFVTSTDMGTKPEDFIHASKEAKSFVGLPESYGGSGNTGIITAYGVVEGIKATLKFIWGSPDCAGRTFAIQGLGKVGANIAKLLLEGGACLIVTDIDQERVTQWREEAQAYRNQIAVTDPEAIYGVEADIFVPCSVGGIINQNTIPQLKVKGIAGAANNQLERPDDGTRLHESGILYAPDYLINSGGLIQVVDELQGFNRQRVLNKIKFIYDALIRIYEISKSENIPTYLAADRLAEERLEQARMLKKIYVKQS
jgi:glutamate dehydrogenase/leucine dehydrogenase